VRAADPTMDPFDGYTARIAAIVSRGRSINGRVPFRFPVRQRDHGHGRKGPLPVRYRGFGVDHRIPGRVHVRAG